MSSKVRLSLGCEKRPKSPTLSTNALSYQQNKGFPPYLLAFNSNPYKFVIGIKLFLTTINLITL
jgi:hypothetical protein